MFDKKLGSMKLVKEVNPDGAALEATGMGRTACCIRASAMVTNGKAFHYLKKLFKSFFIIA